VDEVVGAWVGVAVGVRVGVRVGVEVSVGVFDSALAFAPEEPELEPVLNTTMFAC
jgi:hypothetical protein